MASCPAPRVARDRLSELPDEVLLAILSHLPPRLGARTAARARRFRHLWRLCPSLHLRCRLPGFLPLARAALLDRSAPLRALRLDLSAFAFASASPRAARLISALLLKARSLGARHLGLDHLPLAHLAPLLPALFSISSLRSLSLCLCLCLCLCCCARTRTGTSTGTGTGAVDHLPGPLPLPSASPLAHLSSLQLHLRHTDHVRLLSHLASTLPALETVSLKAHAVRIGSFRLSSPTVRSLRLTILADDSILDSVRLCVPSLESFRLETRGCFHPLPRIHGFAPNLRKALLALSRLHPEDVGFLLELLHFCKPAKELSLTVKECKVLNIFSIYFHITHHQIFLLEKKMSLFVYNWLPIL